MNQINPFENQNINSKIYTGATKKVDTSATDNIFVNSNKVDTPDSIFNNKLEVEGNKRLIDSLLKLDPENKKLNNAKNEIEFILQSLNGKSENKFPDA